LLTETVLQTTADLSPVHTSNNVERYKLNDSFDNVECCFDIVADVDGALRLVLQFLLFVLGT